MRTQILLIAAAVILTAALLFSGFRLWQYFSAEQEIETQFIELTRLIQTPMPSTMGTEQTPAPSNSLEPGQSPDPFSPTEPGRTPKPKPAWTAADQYERLFAQNPDMIGWISIPGTTVNYPVMQSPDRPDFYLNHSFDKKPSKYGVPYAAENCSIDPQSDNITIYGHRMKSGKMFGVLGSYKDKSFYLKHPVIQFDTRAGFGRYEILAVFKVNPADFPYHLFVNAHNEMVFGAFVRQCKTLSFYDTGVTAKFGDKLITLSTCENADQNSRLVVVAKKMGGEPGA